MGDRAYLSESLKRELLANQVLELLAQNKYGQPIELDDCQLLFYKRINRLIEIVSRQLVNNLKIKKIWACNLWHFTNLIYRKVLSHTFSVMFCLREGLNPLSFPRLVFC